MQTRLSRREDNSSNSAIKRALDIGSAEYRITEEQTNKKNREQIHANSNKMIEAIMPKL